MLVETYGSYHGGDFRGEGLVEHLFVRIRVQSFVGDGGSAPLDCALLEGELASKLLAALREQDLQELAAEIASEWDLPTEAVQSGLNTLRSHLELVQGDAALLYEMT